MRVQVVKALDGGKLKTKPQGLITETGTAVQACGANEGHAGINGHRMWEIRKGDTVAVI